MSQAEDAISDGKSTRRVACIALGAERIFNYREGPLNGMSLERVRLEWFVCGFVHSEDGSGGTESRGRVSLDRRRVRIKRSSNRPFEERPRSP